MSRMSEIHADLSNVMRLHPSEPPLGDSVELGAAILAKRAAVLLMCSPDMSRGYRAEIIRAAADGDAERVQRALSAWRMA
jgi:hypothetical protein